MDILPFYEAVRWMLRGGEMDGRHINSRRASCWVRHKYVKHVWDDNLSNLAASGIKA